MKIQKVLFNNRKRVFEVEAGSKHFVFPYAKLQPAPSAEERVAEASVDRELGREGFTYKLESGQEGTVHIDHVLEYNEDPDYLRDLLLYKLTLEAQRRVKSSTLSRREIIRRLGTSAAQFYRLLDQKNYRKSIDQLLSLLRVLDCDVELVVKDRASHSA
ncbi:MAG: helix-turn-helix domain-containing protein [Candidatus Binatia bacterium]